METALALLGDSDTTSHCVGGTVTTDCLNTCHLRVLGSLVPPLLAKNKKATSRKVAFLYDFKAKIWWPLLGLNQRPSDYESPALTTELRGQAARL